jgi:PAS domain S-box-containing protein
MTDQLLTHSELETRGSWQTYTIADGLAGLRVEHIVEDADGYLWFGTYDSGVSRFDGEEFLTFTREDGLCGDRVFAAHLDQQGRLWLGSDGGFCRHDGGRFERFELPGRTVQFICEDRQDRLWLGGLGVLGYFDGEAFRDLLPTCEQRIGWRPAGRCFGVMEDVQGDIWFGFERVIRFDGERFYCYGREEGLPAVQDAYAVGSGSGDRIWVGGYGLVEWDGERFREVHSWTGGAVRKIQTDQKGLIWVSINGGEVLCHDGTAFQVFPGYEDVLPNVVNGICRDREGNIWFATWGRGAVRCDPHIVEINGAQRNFRQREPLALAKDGEGNVWMGFRHPPQRPADAILARFGGEELEEFGREQGIELGGCYAICADAGERVWFGGARLTDGEDERSPDWAGVGALYCYDGTDFQLLDMGDLGGHAVSGLAAGDAEELFIGIRDLEKGEARLLRYDGKGFQVLFREREDDPHGCIIFSILRTRRGDLWFGVGNVEGEGKGRGIFHWRGGNEFDQYTAAEGLIDDRVQEIVEDREGRLWCATRSGISRFDGVSFRNYTAHDGLPNNDVSCICADGRGGFWIATDGGVAHFDGDRWQVVRSAQIGIPWRIAVDRRKDLWCAGLMGIVRYTPGVTPPRVHLSRVVADRVFDAPVNRELSTHARDLEFEYRGMSFRTPVRQLRYVWRLEGWDAEWSAPTAEGRAAYRDLPPGEYLFQVKAIDWDLNESEPASVAVKIKADPRDEQISELERGVQERTRELEEHIRQLRATELVRACVWNLKRPEEIDRLLDAVREALKLLEIPFHGWGINVIDVPSRSVEVWVHVPGEGRERRKFEGAVSLVERIWQQQQMAYRRDLQKEDAYGERDGLMNSFQKPVRSILDVPFSHGTLAINSLEPDAFPPVRIAALQMLAGVLSEGFRRMEDLRGLEDRNRSLEREVEEREKAEGTVRRTRDNLARLNEELEERVRARTAELSASEERYRAFVEQSVEGVWRAEFDQSVPIDAPEEEQFELLYRHAYLAECNEVFARQYGYSRVDEVLGLRAGDFIPQSSPRSRESWMPFIRSGYKLTNHELREFDRHGNLFYSLNNIMGIAEDGNLIRIWGIRHDITGQKQAEEALRNLATRFSALSSSELLEQVSRHLTEALDLDYAFIGELTPDGQSVRVLAGVGRGEPLDPFEYDLTGTPCENVMGQGMCDYPSGVQELFPRDSLLIEMDIEGYMGTPLLNRAGEPLGIMVLLDGKPIANQDAAESLFGIFADRISAEMERMQAKKALQESEKYLTRAQRIAHLGHWKMDTETREITGSDELFRIFGLSREEATLDAFVGVVHPDDREYDLRHIARGITHGENWDIEHRLIPKDGTEKIVRAIGEAVTDESGKTVELVGTVHDITERKQVEEALKENQRRLQTLSRRLVQAQEEERGRISRDLHDEIGQALTALKISLQTVQQLSGEETIASNLGDSIEIAEATLQQVRDLSLDLRPSLLDDLGLVPALRWYLDRQSQRVGFAGELQTELEEPELDASLETTCFRIAQEALTNVARYAQAENVRIEIGLQDGEFHMAIADDGTGFDVDAALERASGGASLGLLSMRERAELTGGRTEIESVPEQGTTIRVFFPFPSAGNGGEEKQA